jgi:hypothetical protein
LIYSISSMLGSNSRSVATGVSMSASGTVLPAVLWLK